MTVRRRQLSLERQIAAAGRSMRADDELAETIGAWVGTKFYKAVHDDRWIVVHAGEAIPPRLVELVPEDAREPLDDWRARQRVNGDDATRPLHHSGLFRRRG